MSSHDEFRDKLIGEGCTKRTRKILAHAAAHRKLYSEIDSLRLDRDRCRHTLDCLYSQMVTLVNPDEFQDESNLRPRRWKIMVGDGVFYEFDGLTRREAEIVWRDAWGLN